MSALNGLAQCPGFAALGSVIDSESGKAADTGTAVGRACQLWHQKGENPTALAAALQQTETEVGDHPKADFDDVRKWAEGYASDPRNVGVVVKDSCEKRVTLKVGAYDLVGHVDQVRRHPKTGALTVWDIKSGQGKRLSACSCGELSKTAMNGRDMLALYAWQISAYALACTEAYGETVLPGGFIRIRSYAWNTRCKWKKDDPSTCPAFFFTPWSLDICREMMASVQSHLEMLDAGKVHLHPGSHCQWCPGEAPHLCGARVADAFGG